MCQRELKSSCSKMSNLHLMKPFLCQSTNYPSILVQFSYRWKNNLWGSTLDCIYCLMLRLSLFSKNSSCRYIFAVHIKIRHGTDPLFWLVCCWVHCQRIIYSLPNNKMWRICYRELSRSSYLQHILRCNLLSISEFAGKMSFSLWNSNIGS